MSDVAAVLTALIQLALVLADPVRRLVRRRRTTPKADPSGTNQAPTQVRTSPGSWASVIRPTCSAGASRQPTSAARCTPTWPSESCSNRQTAYTAPERCPSSTDRQAD
jgi:hypothetical protein